MDRKYRIRKFDWGPLIDEFLLRNFDWELRLGRFYWGVLSGTLVEEFLLGRFD